ncbi:MAG: endonuclease III [Candidatus Aenigmarchaeota archaeon]|nr:endonuclease III [Candidatus Aenigmarchaeota archaeon]
MRKKHIPVVISLIKKMVSKFEEPLITQVSHKNQSPYEVLISCLLSLRTRDETTKKASYRLFQLAKTPQQMVKLNVKSIEKAIFPVGFYRVKARRIKDISKVILEQYKGKVPDTMEELLKLKGVGRKTANIVLVYGYRKEGMPIDIHCHRIPNRLGWIETKTPEQTEQELRKLIPKRFWADFNDTFVTFGQNICKPVKPHCWECPVTKYCKYYDEVVTSQFTNQIPTIKKK